MRGGLLTLLIIALAGLGLFRPLLAVGAYVWFSLLRPDYLAFAVASFPYSPTLGIVATLSASRFVSRLGLLVKSPLFLSFLTLQLFVLLSVLLAVDPTLSYGPYTVYLIVLQMALLIPLVVQRTDDMRWMFWVLIASTGLLGAKYGLYAVVHGGTRYSAGYAGMLSDNNDLGLAFSMIVPIIWYMLALCESLLLRCVLIVCLSANVAAIVMTFSRGAALSFGVVAIMIAMRSKRRALILLMLLGVLSSAIYLVKDAYLDRLGTLKDPEAEGSAFARLLYAKAAFAMWLDFPVFGVGYGLENARLLQRKYISQVAPEYAGSATFGDQVNHNSYMQMLTDSGAPAFVAYVGLLFGTIWWLGRSARRVATYGNGDQHYPYALQCSLLAYGVGSSFLSRLQFDMFYVLLFCAMAWYHVARVLAAEHGVSTIDSICEDRPIRYGAKWIK